MFDKILIANRGEIAVRVMRTARRLGIRTVAVYSQADADAMHVQLADEAVCIGPAPASESYLRGDVILEAARRTGAQAIHPGYGFLSENAAFAAACVKASIVFIGPPPSAIEAMGSKAESKRLMEAAGVPLVPGYHGDEQSLPRLSTQAQHIGFPVLIKASAGGGGKGMRIVNATSEFKDALASAKREAKAAFGDDSVLLEKYLTHTRHVEVQVFADTLGNCVYLSDRDCSLQRRHQKVVEEAPAPNLPDDLRQRMGNAAVAAARAVHYVGAGTVEFMYANGEFYFIEMNTRLQVEHPVTEMITGLDLVEWQLRVACGEPLPLAQQEITHRGHAFEARLYAEDATREFLPAIGRLTHLRPPATDAHVRVDTGVRTGDEISLYYDPLIAKLIVWDQDRAAALRRLRGALEDYEIAGLTTNLELLAHIAVHPAFAAAQIDTGFIERHRQQLIKPKSSPPDEVLSFAALAVLLACARARQAQRARSGDPYSPWGEVNGWLLNQDNYQSLIFIHDEQRHAVVLHFRDKGYELEFAAGHRVQVTEVVFNDNTLHATIHGLRMRAAVVLNANDVTVIRSGCTWRLRRDDPATSTTQQDGGAGRLSAPMPGKVTAVLVKEGAAIKRGQALLVLEAMKMEHTVLAPADGVVAKLHFGAGDKVDEGAELLTLE